MAPSIRPLGVPKGDGTVRVAPDRFRGPNGGCCARDYNGDGDCPDHKPCPGGCG